MGSIIRRRFRLRLVIYLALCLATIIVVTSWNGYSGTHPIRWFGLNSDSMRIVATQARPMPGNASTSSLDGLQMTIGNMRWCDGQLQCTLLLAWERWPPRWALSHILPVYCHFLSSSGSVINQVIVTVRLDEDFIRFNKNQDAQTIAVPVPQEAEFITATLALSKLTTRKLELPQR
jgi:hypothetical protein